MQAATEQVAMAPSSVPARPAKPPRSRMMRQYDLVERVRSYNPDTNEDLLNRAYVYAMKAHGAQTRASGDPYFSHPLEVAAILAGPGNPVVGTAFQAIFGSGVYSDLAALGTIVGMTTLLVVGIVTTVYGRQSRRGERSSRLGRKSSRVSMSRSQAACASTTTRALRGRRR